MKKVLYLLSCTFFLLACKKQIGQDYQGDSRDLPGFIPAGYMGNVKTGLKDSLGIEDFLQVDFLHGTLSKQKKAWYLRLGWIHKRIDRDFLLMQTDSLGHIMQGKLVYLDKDSSADRSLFNGSISLLGFNRTLLLNSTINNGFVLALHPRLFSVGQTEGNSVEPFLVPAPSEAGPPYQQLPEVVVVGYIPSSAGAGISYTDLILLESLASFSPSGSGGLSSTGPGEGSGGSASGNGEGGPGLYNPVSGVYSPIAGSSGPGVQPSSDITINYETSGSLPAINLQAYMNCFSSIPDGGAQCSVTIFTDLPVNDNPLLIFNFNSGAVGHSYLQLTKTGEGQSISQVIGFTAAKPFQSMISPGAVGSKIVDDQGHKYNASLTMKITATEFNTEIASIQSLSAKNYDLVNFNCVNFSVQVINAIRGTNPLVVPPLQIPGAGQSLSSTPEGLYILLSRMKVAGGADASSIVTDEILFSGLSHGACN